MPSPTMMIYWIAGGVALGLFLYLLVVLCKPESF